MFVDSQIVVRCLSHVGHEECRGSNLFKRSRYYWRWIGKSSFANPTTNGCANVLANIGCKDSFNLMIYEQCSAQVNLFLFAYSVGVTAQCLVC